MIFEGFKSSLEALSFILGVLLLTHFSESLIAETHMSILLAMRSLKVSRKGAHKEISLHTIKKKSTPKV